MFGADNFCGFVAVTSLCSEIYLTCFLLCHVLFEKLFIHSFFITNLQFHCYDTMKMTLTKCCCNWCILLYGDEQQIPGVSTADNWNVVRKNV